MDKLLGTNYQTQEPTNENRFSHVLKLQYMNPNTKICIKKQ